MTRATQRHDPAWLPARRQDATEQLHAVGWPTRKLERWRFTPLDELAKVPIEPPPPADAPAEAVRWANERLGDDGTRRVVVVNGQPVALDSDAGAIEIHRLVDVLRDEPALVEPHLARLARPDYFTALNAALFDDGVVIWVPAGAHGDAPIHVVHVADPGDEPAAAYTRLLVVAERDSEAELVETFLYRDGARHVTNSVTELALAPNARLDHTRIHEGAPHGFHVGRLAVHQQRDASYTSHTVALGGGFYRLDLDTVLDGEGAECTLDGVYHVSGDDFVDHHTRIEHAKPHGTSRERYRGLLDGRGRAVFDGTIHVRRDAQQTSAHQENHNLLLSDDAGLHTKPHLEIDADDVKCSHGATTGTLDDEQLYYLRARGIGADEARAILTYGFARAVLDDIPHAPIRRRLAEAVKTRIPRGATLEELP